MTLVSSGVCNRVVAAGRKEAIFASRLQSGRTQALRLSVLRFVFRWDIVFLQFSLGCFLFPSILSNVSEHPGAAFCRVVEAGKYTFSFLAVVKVVRLSVWIENLYYFFIIVLLYLFLLLRAHKLLPCCSLLVFFSGSFKSNNVANTC